MLSGGIFSIVTALVLIMIDGIVPASTKIVFVSVIYFLMACGALWIAETKIEKDEQDEDEVEVINVDE